MVLKGGKMRERNVWVIAALVVLLLAAVVYIAIDKYSAKKVERDNLIYQQGVQTGYQQTVIQIANSVSTCQQVPLVVGNRTINIIWIECLNQPD